MTFGRKRRQRVPVSVGVLGTLLIFFCLMATALAVLLMRDDTQDEREAGNRVVYGLTLEPSGFDPHRHISNELGIPLFSVYDTLIYRHPQTMDFVPGLAERWEMSPDGLAWTFYLKQGVVFHDGTPLNAQAVGFNLDRVMNPEIGSAKARGLLGPYLGYEIVDEYTIRLSLSEPFAPLLDGLTQVYLGIASPTALTEHSNNTYQWHQVGTGPYRVEEIVPGDRIVLRRNEDYAWGPVFYAPVSGQSLDTIEFRFYTDPPTRSLALESGEVQVVGELLPTDTELLVGNPALQIFRVPIAGTPQQFFINTRKSPGDEVSFRQALLYATNRTAIIEAVFQGQSPLAYGPLTAATLHYDASIASQYSFDPDYARELLLGIGYQDSDSDGMLDRNGEPLGLTMVFAPWNQMSDVAQLIQSQWRDVGIAVDLIQVPDYPTLAGYAQEGDYDLIALYDFGVDASILNQFYLSDGSRNWSGFSDAELDEWLSEAIHVIGDTERGQLYAAAQRRIMEQAVVLPIRDYVNLNGASARLDGVIFSAQGWWPLLRNFQLTS